MKAHHFVLAVLILVIVYALVEGKFHKGDKLFEKNIMAQVAVVVKDIEKSSKAYAEFFSVEQPDIKITAPLEKAHTNYKGKPTQAQAKLAFIKLDNITIELIEPIGGPSVWKEVLDQKGEGVHHIAFRIKGMEEKLHQLQTIGINTIQRGDYTGGRYAYVDAEEKLCVIVELLENLQQ